MSRGKWITYSPDELSFLQENKEMPRRALHDVFCKKYSRNDVSVDAIKSALLQNSALKRDVPLPHQP